MNKFSKNLSINTIIVFSLLLVMTKLVITFDIDELDTGKHRRQQSVRNDLSVIGQQSSSVQMRHMYTQTVSPVGWRCHCWNATTDIQIDFQTECACSGKLLYSVPTKLHKYLNRLTIIDAGIVRLKKESLQLYKSTIKDVVLSNLPNLDTIEIGTFRNLRFLRSIYISYCSKLKQIDGVFEGFKSNYFRSLHILKCGLEKIPQLSPLQQTGKIIQIIDLEGNYLTHIPENSIQIKAEQIILSFNQIEQIDNYAFNGAEIGKLSLKGNKQLSNLPDNVFKGLIDIRELDLSTTRITNLPVEGLSTLETLRIENTPSLKVIPSIYDFKHLKQAWLTYSFHCCAFKYPARHDPTKHKNYQIYLKHIQSYCENNSKSSQERKKRGTETSYSTGSFFLSGESWDAPISNKGINDSFDNGFRADDPNGLMKEGINEDVFGTFHQTSVVLNSNNTVICGSLSLRFDVQCYPQPNQLNPCEDIMGFEWLRICVWIVLVTALFGNLAVLIVLLSTSCSDLSVPKFLMCHLAVADLFMGIYLLMLASMDLLSKSVYFNYAYDWQHGPGCQIAGFLTMLANQLSIFTLSVITMERWFAITHAIYLNRRIKLSMAARIMVVGWVYSILMASLPLFGISNYSATSICLPIECKELPDMIYLFTLLIITGLAFVLIVICYTQIYFSLNSADTCSNASGGTAIEMTVARKMALLVFTDFACWAPIAFFSFTALLGYPLIDVTRSKILLVFFYPLNSCANPYLYALLTTQYKRDLYSLLSRFGLCTKRAHKYKLTYSFPTTNNSNPIPLNARSSIPGSTVNEVFYVRKSSKSTNEMFV